MTSIRTYLAAAAALGAICAPAAAQNSYGYGYQQQYQRGYSQQGYPQQGYSQQVYPQPYPQQAYPQQSYPGYGYNQGTGNPITDIIDSLVGNRYNVTDRQAVRQCANAAMAQVGQQYGGYGNSRGKMRVTSINEVQRRGNGLRVSGTMSSDAGYGDQYRNGQDYGRYDRNENRGNGAAVSFRCNVAYNGSVTGLRISRY